MESSMIVFKPLLSILSVFGLYVSSFKPVCCRNVLRWLLSLGALVFGVFAVVHNIGPRIIALFSDSVHEEFFVNFLFSLILFQLTCNSVWLSVSVSRNLTKLFESLEKYLADYNVSHGSRKRRSAVVISCVIALFLIVSTAGRQYSFEADPTCLDRKQLGRVLLCLAEEGFSVIECTYVSSYGVLPPFLYFVLWAAIFAEARQLNRNMDEVDFETCDQAALRVEKFRLRHVALCGLVDRANLVLRHFLFCSYAFGLSLLLFALRGLMKGDANERSVVILGYTLVLVCLQMVAVTLSGAILCSVLHRPAGILYNLMIQNNAELFQVVSAFLWRLHHGSIGLNVYGLFTIDASTVLMVCGTVVTYAIVIVQFQPGSVCDVIPAPELAISNITELSI